MSLYRPSRRQPWKALRIAIVVSAVLSLGACASAPTGSHPPVKPVETAGLSKPGETTLATAAVNVASVDVAAGHSPASKRLETAAATPAPEASEPADSGNSLSRVQLRQLEQDVSARRDLWERLKGGFSMPDLDNDLVRKWELWYSSRPDYVERMTNRGGRYLFHILEEVENKGLPSELALLPFIESAFNPQALSVARASGMWQFMPATGKDFELKQNVFRDDRRDVLASTRAALDYLQALQRNLGDWQLALAAYNWGQGNVQRAMAKNQRAGLPTVYEQLPMPDETRNYLPKLQAVKNILLRPQAFGLTLPELHNHPFFLSVAIDRDIDVALAAQLAGLSMDEFQALNPQLNKPVILAAGTPRLLLPYDNANRFLREWVAYRGPTASWTAWVAPRSMKPAEAAKLVGMPEARLRDVNRIPAKMIVKAGSTLLIPRAPHTTKDVGMEVAQNGMLALAPEAIRKPVKKGSAKGAPSGKRARATSKNPAASQGTAGKAKTSNQARVAQNATPTTAGSKR